MKVNVFPEKVPKGGLPVWERVRARLAGSLARTVFVPDVCMFTLIIVAPEKETIGWSTISTRKVNVEHWGSLSQIFASIE